MGRVTGNAAVRKTARLSEERSRSTLPGAGGDPSPGPSGLPHGALGAEPSSPGACHSPGGLISETGLRPAYVPPAQSRQRSGGRLKGSHPHEWSTPLAPLE
jgi:hypothetical protein